MAVNRLEWLLSADKHASEENTNGNPYCSVDPAPPAVKKSVAELRLSLLNETLPLFERYRAMFALRNLGSEEAVLALGAGKKSLDYSPALLGLLALWNMTFEEVKQTQLNGTLLCLQACSVPALCSVTRSPTCWGRCSTQQRCPTCVQLWSAPLRTPWSGTRLQRLSAPLGSKNV